jgi:hypothetical protein
MIDLIAGMIGRIGSCADGIATLVRRYSEEACLRQRGNLAFQKNRDTPNPCSMRTRGALS